MAEHNAVEALKVSEKRFKDVAETISDYIWETDCDGKYTYTSPNVEKILGYTPDEMLNINGYDIIVPEDLARSKAVFAEIIEKKIPLKDFVTWNFKKDGSRHLPAKQW